MRERAPNKGKRLAFVCDCDCGESRVIAGQVLRGGVSKSCGCLRRELGVKLGEASRKHGHGGSGSESPEYRAWGSMRSRCLNANHRQFEHYGGRGITICQRWLDSFQAFLDDMGPRPSKAHSLDRRDNSRGYSPGNCQWATSKEQNRNKRDNLLITIGGDTKTITEWAEESSVCMRTIRRRLAAGIDPEEAVFGGAYKGKRQS